MIANTDFFTNNIIVVRVTITRNYLAARMSKCYVIAFSYELLVFTNLSGSKQRIYRRMLA